MIDIRSLWNRKKEPFKDAFYEVTENNFFQGDLHDEVNGNNDKDGSCSSKKEEWSLTIFSKKRKFPVKKIKIQRPLRIGRERHNDIVVNGREQHRYVLEIGMDEQGLFVNSLEHEDGEYAYGDGCYNHLAPRTSLIPPNNMPLKITYGNLIYVIENANYKRSAAEKGKVIRHENQITG